jgi:hypothetical protein
MTAEQVLAKLYQLRKEFDDDREDETYQALNHAFLFLSYRIAEFKQYLEEAQARESKEQK